MRKPYRKKNSFDSSNVMHTVKPENEETI